MVSRPAIQRGDVVLLDLDPTRGGEIKKTRPCLVVSPDDLNVHLRTLIVLPMTTGGHAYPFRLPCTFQRKKGFVVADQVRTVDRDRVVRKLGTIPAPLLEQVLAVMREMFES